MLTFACIEGNKETGNYVLCSNDSSEEEKIVFIVKRFGIGNAVYNRVKFSAGGVKLSERFCQPQEVKACQKALKKFELKSELVQESSKHFKYYPYGRPHDIEEGGMTDLETGEVFFSPGEKASYCEVKQFGTKKEHYTWHPYDLEKSCYRKEPLSPLLILFFKAAMGDEDITGHLKRVEE